MKGIFNVLRAFILNNGDGIYEEKINQLKQR